MHAANMRNIYISRKILGANTILHAMKKTIRYSSSRRTHRTSARDFLYQYFLLTIMFNLKFRPHRWTTAFDHTINWSNKITMEEQY